MIRRHHVVKDFFEEGEALRATLDAAFSNTYTDKIRWQYFCDPQIYTYLRADPKAVFPAPVLIRFVQRLHQWCLDNLGLVPIGTPSLHLMVNGCKLGLHSDFHNGAWGYVYSLTRWQHRKFFGGETLLMRDGAPSYKKHHAHAEILYELFPAHFNQLLIFDDRIVHGTPTIEGSMDPMEGRIALVGHIRATSPVVSGDVKWSHARKVICDALPHLRDRIRNYRDVQGTITHRLAIEPNGRVHSIAILSDNLVTQVTGYEHSEAVAAVKSIIQEALMALRFSPATGRSVAVVPLLVPLPDLQPIERITPHALSRDAILEWVTSHLNTNGLQGSWEGETFVVREPIAGSIRLEPQEIITSFDAPMWVPSQRAQFEAFLGEWLSRYPA